MDYVSLLPEYDGECLEKGVAIIYEREDVGAILDLLTFMVDFKHRNEDEICNVPSVIFREERIYPEYLLEGMCDHVIGPNSEMNEDIITQILDTDQKFFTEYMGHLRQIIIPKKEISREDENHPLFPVYDFFREVEYNFFPLTHDVH